MRADVLHYFHVDVFDLPGHRAMPLIALLQHYWTPIPMSDPPMWRTAVLPVLERAEQERREQDETLLIGAAELAEIGGEYRTSG